MNSENKKKKTTLRYAFYGHHKCATSWISGFVDLVCSYTGMRTATFNNIKQFDGDLFKYLQANPVDFVSYTNANVDQIRPLGEVPAFHVIRDPRDIVVSAYFSHLKTHVTKPWPELTEYRDKLQKLDREAGLLEEVRYSESNLQRLSEWDYEQGQVLEWVSRNL